MASTPDFRLTFFEECRELLETVEADLGRLAAGARDSETLNAIFRAVHSIKGGAGAFGMNRLVGFAHDIETLLDRMRSGAMGITGDLAALLTRSIDLLSDLVQEVQNGVSVPASQEETLREGLRAAIGAGALPVETHSGQPIGLVRFKRRFAIGFAPRRELIHHANEPILLLRGLRRLGAMEVEIDAGALPELERMDADDIYLRWRILLETDADEADIRDIFEFVEDDCLLDITPAETTRAIAAPEDTAPRRSGGASASVRVDICKLDMLVDLVGEMVTAQAILAETAAVDGRRQPELAKALEGMHNHIRELQENVMSIRAQPVRTVFARLPKLLRDTAVSLGKQACLVMTGDQTELDKTVIEQLSDPLTHMIRNAVDHGIETPEERRARGKDEIGTVRLSAEQRSGRIIITIADDGRGLDRDRLLEKAQSRGLIAPDAVLSAEEIDSLIFMPGLSTAARISDISGRGVGMDVVRQNIQALGGRISIDSEPGQGCCFTLSLPLTLAVMDGMVVRVGMERYIIPVSGIIESLRPRAGDIEAVVGAGQVLAFRGDFTPLLHLGQLFGAAGARSSAERALVVMVDCEAGRFGLVVDDLLGQQQVVIKSLEDNYGPVAGISGATILGSGQVALILDLVGLAMLARHVGAAGAAARPRPASMEIL